MEVCIPYMRKFNGIRSPFVLPAVIRVCSVTRMYAAPLPSWRVLRNASSLFDPLVKDKSQGERREMRKRERRPSQPQLQQRHLPCQKGVVEGGRYIAVGLARGFRRVFFSPRVAPQGKDRCIFSSLRIAFLVFLLIVVQVQPSNIHS